MEVLSPLAAFQAICIALAVGVVVDARKEPPPWRYLLFLLALVLAACGVFASPVGSRWPSALSAMESLGGSPVVWFVTLIAVYFMARPLRKRRTEAPPATASHDQFEPVQREYLSVAGGQKMAAEINSRMDQDHLNLRDELGKLSHRLDVHRTKMNEIASLVIAHSQLVYLQNTPQPTVPERRAKGTPAPLERISPLTIYDHIIEDLKRRGFDLDGIIKMTEARVSAELAKPDVIQVLPDEPYAWASVDEKKNWHVAKVKFEALGVLWDAAKQPASMVRPSDQLVRGYEHE